MAHTQRVLVRHPNAPSGPFLHPPPLASGEDLGDITEDEIDAVARLILDFYNEWNEQ